MSEIITRLTPKIVDETLSPVFYEMVDSNPFLTIDKRKDIITKWQEKAPDISEAALRVCLSRMEKRYFENYEAMDRVGLKNQIILQQVYANNLLISDTNLANDKKVNAISNSNKVISLVGNLTDLQPSVEIVINTNLDADSLSKSMNKSYGVGDGIDLEVSQNGVYEQPDPSK